MKKIFIIALALSLLGLVPHPSTAGPTAPAAAGPAADGSRTLFDLNTVNYDELVSLRGIGPSLAERILEYRAGSGSFVRLDQLLEVKGVGEKNFARFKEYFTLTPPPSPVAKTTPNTPR
jgi:competence protein ComEA